jgi:DNA-binding LacI/PurR family transcriptional regulator
MNSKLLRAPRSASVNLFTKRLRRARNGGVFLLMTLKQIALRARVSRATVSYALRNHPKIPLATREHIQSVARELGYKPNTRVAGLMAHIRRGRARPFGERIAFVWVHTTREEAQRSFFLRAVLKGARDRAEQSGYALEEFWTSDPDMTDLRLQKIIRARGIVGVVLSPVTTAETSVTLNWDWSAFAAAVVGNVTWTPELHHAGHHHYLGMRMCMLELAKLGCARPAAFVDEATHERAKRAWEGAFLAHHPNEETARALWFLHRKSERRDPAVWLRRAKPDALIVSTTELLGLPAVRVTARELEVPIVSLHWQDEARGIGGVDQCYGRVAAHAVDLVIAQLNLNELGPPDLPRIMLFTGHWVAPTVKQLRLANS